MKKLLLPLLLALALPASAVWTVTSAGTSPVVSDGDWSLTVNNGTSLSVSTAGTSTLLDMSTLCEDTGLSPTACNNDFLRGNASIVEVRLPTSLESLSKQCFQNCYALTTVELGPSFRRFASTHAFSQCYSLTTVYTRGEPKVEGLVKLPDAVDSVPGFTFEMPWNHNNTTVKQILARGVTAVDTAAFYRMAGATNIVLSAGLYSVTSSNDNGPFYMCGSLSTLFPSNLNLTAAVGQSAFREIPLDHDLDFSGSTFTSVGVNSFFGIKLKDGCRITMPATLNTVQNQAFKQYQNSRSPNIVRIRFLGEAPAFSGTYNLSPYNASKHNVLYVDAKKCPSWTASGFTSVEDDPTLLDQASYPGPKTLGKSTLGVTESDRWNWLVQENLPKGPTYWEVVGTDDAGVVTIASTNGYWTLSLTPTGAGGYLAKCLSCAAPAAEALELGKIEDDTDLPLAGLAEGAFADCRKLSGVTIPAGADALGAHAFSNCTALAKVVLPATFSWNAAGAGAFEGCSALTRLGLSSQNVTANQLALPAAATTLADALFAGCTQFTSFSGPGVTAVGARVFDGCSALATVTVPGGIGALAAVGEAAFRGTALTATMDFTDTPLTAIPASIFENCAGVSLVILPATIANVGAAAFKNMAPGANVSFAGNPPEFGELALQPPADAAGCRYVVRVEFDYDNLQLWRAEGFTATTSAMKDAPDYIGPSMLGRTTLGTDGETGNWLFSLDPDLVWWISGKSTYARPDNNGTVQTTVVTDGDWEMHVFVVGSVTNLAPKLCVAGGMLDMTTLDTDTGLFPSVLGYKSFYGLAAGTGPAVVRLPDSVTTLGDRCFQDNKTIVEMEVGARFASMGTAPFREANAFATFYQRGEVERVEGRVAVPANVTTLPESCFYNCDGVKEAIAPGVVSLGHSCFYNDGALTNAVFSPDLHTVTGGGNGAFYQCWALRTISPSKMNLRSTGTDAFRELRLDHGLDFSGATFTSLPERTLYDIHCTGPDGKPRPITLPKTLRTVGKQALYGQAAWNQLYVFLGDKPTFGENALKPVQPGDAGKRFFIVADVKRYPAWKETDFTPLADADKAFPDYPAVYLHHVPEYPGVDVLGWLSTAAGGYKNWLIQLKHAETLMLLR